MWMRSDYNICICLKRFYNANLCFSALENGIFSSPMKVDNHNFALLDIKMIELYIIINYYDCNIYRILVVITYPYPYGYITNRLY